MKTKEVIDKIVELIQSKKGFEIKILDLRKLNAIADFFIICSAGSDTQVKAIADEVDKNLRNVGTKSLHKEGYDTLNWVLLDYLDVVVHVFTKDSRAFYSLEKLWGDSLITEIEDE